MRNANRWLLCTILAGSTPMVAQADFSQVFTGNTRGGPTWNRPNSVGTVVTGTSVAYRVDTFTLLDDARCIIYGAQDYDGYLHLYMSSFDPLDQLTNFVAGDDDGDLGIGTSKLEDLDLMAGFYVLVSSGFSNTSAGRYQNTIHCNLAQPLHGGCSFSAYPRDQQTCHHDRFAVRILNVTNHPSDGRATPVRFGSRDSAFYWFFNDTNFEVQIKVLNGCAINGFWWVFFAGTTNQGHRIQVGDAITQLVRTYDLALGPPSPARTDTQAFPCS